MALASVLPPFEPHTYLLPPLLYFSYYMSTKTYIYISNYCLYFVASVEPHYSETGVKKGPAGRFPTLSN